MNHAQWSIVGSFPDRLIIRDDGPWDRFPSITNDAEWVVARIYERLNGRVLLYIDTEGRMDQLLVMNGRFAGLELAPK